MEVILSSEINNNLNQLTLIEPELILKICQYFIQSLIINSSTIEFDSDSDCSAYVDAISTLFLECARVNATSDTIKSILTEQGVGEDIQQILTEQYSNHIDTIKKHMTITGITASNIVGISWRLDYSVRSKHAGQENLPMFMLCLNIKEQDSDVIRKVEIITNQEELQDLLNKIKDAVKQVDRVVSINNNN